VNGRASPSRPEGAVTWPALVRLFKTTERREWMLGTGSGVGTVRLLATWALVHDEVPRPRWLDEQWTAEANWSDRWWWLWETRFPEGLPWEAWARLADVNLEYREPTMEQLMLTRMIYPDGTLATIGQQLLSLGLVDVFRRGQRQAAER
jgi:hypothetical protein